MRHRHVIRVGKRLKLGNNMDSEAFCVLHEIAYLAFFKIRAAADLGVNRVLPVAVRPLKGIASVGSGKLVSCNAAEFFPARIDFRVAFVFHRAADLKYKPVHSRCRHKI